LLAARGEFPDSILEWELVPVAPAPFFSDAAYHVGLAFVCAKRQGAEWVLLSGALDLEITDVRSMRPLLERAGVVEADFEACLNSQRTRRVLWQNRFDAAGKGVRGTPAIVAGGTVVEGVLMEDPLRQLLYTISGGTPSGG
jgi:predicted DsbA family dithiol-disulfide isomerase